MSRDFWAGKRVLLTGHTGFKGSWMAMTLGILGAETCGIALAPDTEPSLFRLLSPWPGLDSHLFDIRDRSALGKLLSAAEFDVVIHMAAQTLVRRSFEIPYETFDVNIMGTLALLDVLAACGRQPVILVVTSDKVYRNDERGIPFREGDPLGGDDPYSASKAACEIATRAFARARGLAVATARAGNVVGGGDFAEDRLLPDVFRAVRANAVLKLRHPDATRPWQHVLDVIFGYLHYAQALAENFDAVPVAVNFGPAGASLTVEAAVAEFSAALGAGVASQVAADAARPEKTRLQLDGSLARQALGFRNTLSQPEAIRWAGEWYRRFLDGEPAAGITRAQVEAYRVANAGR